ncbi:hypothetical protein PGB34_02920 [Xenophilus arseniciresistens]|uniref:Lipoprotein n=1 Tax=Xenophilus arseniciresistens TaxID=1283306 RepID=A0AAE3SXS5_9BURK|nr:hypothetical protein [Xenophilus arseniciresistens]MDA7415307.1 hypothetical protein [Xenophilus arseniciresistens]
MRTFHAPASFVRRSALALPLAAAATWLAGCGTRAPAPAPDANSAAARAYRQSAARHIYQRHASRIYAGKLPPLLYAIGTLQVTLDSDGGVRRLNWLRAPSHAPEVVREIERMVRADAPFPAPPGRNGVVWTDTWLWDKSGRFQLDTLTEGQLQE